MSLVRFVTADVLMFIHVFIGTPYFLARIILTSTKSQDEKNKPSALHRYLNAVTRTLIWWETSFLAQNSLFGKKQLEKKKETHVFIKPSAVGRNQGAFDDSILPVQLVDKDKKESTRAIWYYEPSSKSPKPTVTRKARDVPVLLYFHGGAFVRFTADHFLYQPMLSNLSKGAKVDVLAVSHRLAPGSKFPSHLFQAYSAFVYLRSLGYERIVVGGDSGGANVALQLHHYLQKKDTESLKHIVGIFMICAWLDLSDDHKEKKSEYASEDQISTSLLEKGARSLQTGGVPVLSNIWLSPFSWIKEDSSLLASLPPIYALTGEIEVLYPENIEFAKAVKNVKKEQDDYVHVIAGGGVHNFVIQPWSATRTEAYFKDAAPWIQRVTA